MLSGTDCFSKGMENDPYALFPSINEIQGSEYRHADARLSSAMPRPTFQTSARCSAFAADWFCGSELCPAAGFPFGISTALFSISTRLNRDGDSTSCRDGGDSGTTHFITFSNTSGVSVLGAAILSYRGWRQMFEKNMLQHPATWCCPKLVFRHFAETALVW